jgi:phosphoesterase RecJ-like protein
MNQLYTQPQDHPETALIMTHTMPDGDAVGSVIALHELLTLKGIRAWIVMDDELPESLAWLKDPRFVKRSDVRVAVGGYDVFVVDSSDLSRITDRIDLFTQARNTFNIDHHITNDYFAKFNLVDAKASSAGELIYRLFVAENLDLSLKAAEAIYVAISTDTGSFRYSNTSSETMRLAGVLIDSGIDTVAINTSLYHTRPLDSVRLLGIALENLDLPRNGQIAVSYVSLIQAEFAGVKNYETDGICEFLRDISGVEVALFLKETAPEVFKISARSKHCFDVSRLALRFGGGGHTRAAGFTVNGIMEEVKQKILSEIELTGCAK